MPVISSHNCVKYDGVTYYRRSINGYSILHKIIDGKIDWYHYVYEHRLIYELTNNTKLDKDTIIHHRNRDRSDNRPDNLVAMSHEEHVVLHAKESGKHIGPNHCIDCGKEIGSKAKRCVECSRKHRQVESHPTKDELSRMITTMSNSEIARALNVSDKAVGKWRAAYGLPSAKSQISPMQSQCTAQQNVDMI